LTLPNGSAGQRLPLVVMPHGGPEARDSATFDSWAQFLASRGYAVLQPQYRGSAGFGLRHRNAGRRQWGLLVQDDISDGVMHLIKTGVADPARVCIVGWSFGGYATMAGLAFSPDLYKCGVAGAGVSDLIAMLEYEAKYTGQWLGDNDYWTWLIGSPGADRARLIATSPAQHAAKFKAPLLLVHGKDDTVVPKSQSDLMADSLKAAGRPYEYVVLEGEDHHLSNPSTSKRFLQELERFLAPHLK
jgi:dipeptidyl aminopeptidase/acylaminoacyl peptidase